MVTEKNFAFSGMLESVRFNQITTAVFIPRDIIVHLPRGPLKTRAIINGIPFSVSILYRKDSGRYFPIRSALRREARIEVGDPVDIKFTLIEPGRIHIPREETTLDEHDKTKKIAGKMVVSLQKALSQYVEVVGRFDARLKRRYELVSRSTAKALPRVSGKKKSK